MGGFMKVKKIQIPSETLLDPDAPAWEEVTLEEVSLQPTPIAFIPSTYVRETVKEAEIGKVKAIDVKTMHNGKEIFFRLEWEDKTHNTETVGPNFFADGVGLMFALRPNSIILMGSVGLPVDLWYWRPDLDKPQNFMADGLGTSRITKEGHIFARAQWENSRWKVVLSRTMKMVEKFELIQFKPGEAVKVGFAVWEGSNRERGGVKSYSFDWTELLLEE